MQWFLNHNWMFRKKMFLHKTEKSDTFWIKFPYTVLIFSFKWGLKLHKPNLVCLCRNTPVLTKFTNFRCDNIPAFFFTFYFTSVSSPPTVFYTRPVKAAVNRSCAVKLASTALRVIVSSQSNLVFTGRKPSCSNSLAIQGCSSYLEEWNHASLMAPLSKISGYM